jgi:oligopeptide transport system substrate-binding protein
MYRFLLLISAAVILGLVATLRLSPAEPPADFRIANNEECRSVDPHLIQWTQEFRLGFALFEGLTSLDPDTLRPVPGVAESWDISLDGLTYTFHIRPDARWSNARPITAHHFVASWERGCNPRIASDYNSALFVIRDARRYHDSILAHDAAVADNHPHPPPILPFTQVGAQAPDDRTLRITLEKPCPYLLDLLAGSAPTFWPVYPPALEGVAYDWPPTREPSPSDTYDAGRDRFATRHLWTRPDRFVCNGPYVLESWQFKHKMRLARNPHYWDADNVALDTIDILPMADRNTRFMCYETGAVDMAMDPSAAISRALYTRMLAGDRPDYQHGDNFATYFYRLNVTRPPLDEPLVRQALSQAIDRDGLCRVVWGFGQKPARALVPPHYADAMAAVGPDGRTHTYNGPPGHPDDPGAARDCLTRAGWHYASDSDTPQRDDRPFPILQILYNTDALHDAVAQAVAHMWRTELGIRVELVNVESKVFHERVRKLDYDVARASWYADYMDPTTFLDIFRADSGNNRTGFISPDYDALLDAAAAESHPGRRFGLLARAESLLVQRELPIIPLNFYVGAQLVSPRFGGVAVNARQLILLKHVHPR